MELSETERAYLAGIYDGEGTFSITYHRTLRKDSKKRKVRQTAQPIACLTSVDKRLIDWLELKTVGNIQHYQPKTEYSRHAYLFRTCGFKNIIWLVGQIEEYLIIKKEVAIKVREFCLRRLAKIHISTRSKPISEEEWNIVQQVKNLNKRGVDIPDEK